jgi:hypothetical protein
MEGNGRRLGWIAIALGAVALVVALGGRAQQRWQGYYAPPSVAVQPAAPEQQAPIGPKGDFRQQAPVGPQGDAVPRDMGRFDQDRRGGPGFAGPGHFGRGHFFFLPFMLIGGLFKLVLFGLLIWLGLKLLRGRRGPGGYWHRHEHGDQPHQHGGPEQPGRPGPEQPPYPDDTPQA